MAEEDLHCGLRLLLHVLIRVTVNCENDSSTEILHPVKQDRMQRVLNGKCL